MTFGSTPPTSPSATKDQLMYLVKSWSPPRIVVGIGNATFGAIGGWRGPIIVWRLAGVGAVAAAAAAAGGEKTPAAASPTLVSYSTKI